MALDNINVGDPGTMGLFAFKGKPEEITLAHVFRTIPRGWPIAHKNGTISIPPSDRAFTDGRYPGQSLQRYFTEIVHLPEAHADAAVALLNRYVDQMNTEAAFIRTTTHVTTRPEIAMARRNSYIYSYQENLAWYALKNNLEASGAMVVDLTDMHGRSGAEQATWARDHYVLAADGTAHFLPLAGKTGLERKHNDAQRFTKAQLATLGVDTKEIAPSRLQGGDILEHLPSQTLFVGIRSTANGKMDKQSLKSAHALAASMGMNLVPVPKTQNDVFYHLDTFLTILPDGSAVLLPDATTPAARRAIMHTVTSHGGKVLELPAKSGEFLPLANERRGMATNIITVNGNSFTANAMPEMKEFLANHGFRLFQGPYGWGNAGPHCQINFIKRIKSDGRSDVALAAPEHSGQFAVSSVEHEQLSPNIPAKRIGPQKTELS